MKYRILKKNVRRRRIQQRVRKKIKGDAARPRLSVCRSLKHLYAQAVDDETGRVLVAASSLEKEALPLKTAKENPQYVGETLTRRLKDKGIVPVVFDRGWRPFHGNLKVLAEAARSAGLSF